MGFGLKYLHASSAENAKTGVAEVSKLEDAAHEEGAAQPSSAQPASAPAAPARPNAFSARPPQAGSASVGSSAPSRPSFTTSAPAQPAPAASAAPVRPSFGAPSTTSPPKDQPSRPSFGGPSSLPNARGVFVKNPAKMGGSPSGSPSSAPASSGTTLDMSPQALFEIVCTHRGMSRAAIEAAKTQAQDNPDMVMSQMRRIYEQEIAPSRMKHASDLPKAREEHPDKVVFLLRKDDKERMRIMPRDAAVETGEILLNGTTVENIHAASSPFMAPAELFAAVEPEVAPPAEAPAEHVHRSPKP